jgi:hypothetical protein
MRISLFILAIFLALNIVHAQSTLFFDQQSSTNWDGETVGAVPVSDQPLGQSFTPALSSIDFVRLRLSISTFSVAGTVSVNLWSGGISNGVLLASSIPAVINLSDPGAVVYTNFFFPSSVPLNPGTTYFFQPLVTSETSGPFGGDLNVGLYSPRVYPATYAGGMAYVYGTA